MDFYSIAYDNMRKSVATLNADYTQGKSLEVWRTLDYEAPSLFEGARDALITSLNTFEKAPGVGPYFKRSSLCNVDSPDTYAYWHDIAQAQDKSRSPRAHVCIHGRSLYFTAGDVPLCAPSVRPHTACFRHRIKRDEARRNSKGAKRPMREEG